LGGSDERTLEAAPEPEAGLQVGESHPYHADLPTVAELREHWGSCGETVVLTNGCFDLLHVGHVRYLGEARSLGDRLIVALNDDVSARGLKGPGRPVTPLVERAELLCALRAVDAVVAFPEPTAEAVVRTLAPDVYVKGGDYDARSRRPPEADVAEAVGARVEFLPFTSGQSTSRLIERIRRRS
jgi:D-beta-D-heptose 7-phosphate kinase/D-beta-D-heptose 1-phosphate adenosyltransferase